MHACRAARLADHGDPFAPPGEWYRPGAVLMPGSVEEVQAILRVANEYGTPVWTSSQGRNKGYGGGAPRVSGSFSVSLRRMNRVLEVDEQNCMALVEPAAKLGYGEYRSLSSVVVTLLGVY